MARNTLSDSSTAAGMTSSTPAAADGGKGDEAADGGVSIIPSSDPVLAGGRGADSTDRALCCCDSGGIGCVRECVCCWNC